MNYFLFRFGLLFTLLTSNLFLTFYFLNRWIDSSHSMASYVWMTSIYLITYYTHRLMTRRMVTTNETMVILKANIVALIAIFFIITLAKMGENTSRSLILGYFFLNALNPMWLYWFKKPFLQMSWIRKDVFVVCDNEGYKNVLNWFDKGNPFGYDIAAVMNVDEEPLILIHKKIEILIASGRYHAAIIDIDHSEIYEVNDLIDHIQKNLRRVILLPKISRMPVINGELISSIHHKGMALYIKNNLLSPMDRTIKQTFDWFLSAIGVLVLSPILLTLFFIVFFSTGGHPFFSQKRIGVGGKIFRVWKFRTMYIDADVRLERLKQECKECAEEWEKDFKLKNDPRVTKIGKFLRKTSLDELPQLINVLKGEMSLVGPRPIVEAEIAKYGEYFDYFKAVKPGITGLWQVSGRNDIDYDERVQLDVWYVRNWSVQLDIEILIKTVMVVFGRKGSY